MSVIVQSQINKNTKNNTPHTGECGRSSCPVWACWGSTLNSSLGWQKALTSGFPWFYVHPHHPTTPPLNLYLMYIMTSLISSYRLAKYIGPFSHSQLESALGPFQTLLLSLVLKTCWNQEHSELFTIFPSSMNWLMANATSINSHIDCNSFPCTWGTFATITLIITCLPPGSQASVHDVAEAYRTTPAKPAQWPGLIIHLQVDNQFVVNLCNNFGLASVGGMYGMVADAGVDIFWGQGMGLLVKLVKNHIFLRVPWRHLVNYNTQWGKWHHEINAHRGQRQDGSRIWCGGKDLPNNTSERKPDIWQSLRSGGESTHTISLRFKGCTESYYMQPWSFLQDMLTSPAWRPC